MRELLTPSTELSESLKQLRGFGHQYVRIANALIGVCVGLPRNVVVRKEENVVPAPINDVLMFLLQGAGSSTNTLLDLSDGPGLHTRDCYGIARSIIETLVNACYVMAGGEAIAKQAISHATQKSYADLNRESKIGESIIRVAYSGTLDPQRVVELEALVAQFTSRSGREKGWIEDRIDDRIATVGKVLGADVLASPHAARFSGYRHSSELLHGTLFSSHFFFGASSPSGPPRTKKELAEFIGDQHLLILIGVILGWHGTIGAFHSAYGYGTAYRHSEKLQEEMTKIPIVSDKK